MPALPVVSIHSRPPGREKPAHSCRSRRCQPFQSTPAHQDGRNPIARASKYSFEGFNPLPPTRTGETVPPQGPRHDGCVSIHSRPPGREKRPDSLQLRVKLRVSIHSRPPGREKLLLQRAVQHGLVSIHSRPPGREKRGLPRPVGARVAVSIHSRPPGREKRQIHCNSGSNCVFQSTPAHQDGRNGKPFWVVPVGLPRSVCAKPLSKVQFFAW